MPYGNAGGYVNHYDGQTWQRAPDVPSLLTNVRHAPGVGTIAVGRDGTILQLAATPVPGFTELRTGSVQTLAGVFGNDRITQVRPGYSDALSSIDRRIDLATCRTGRG